MPTLHNVTDTTKAILKWGVILGVSAICILLLYRGALIVKEMYFPTPRIPPTVLFGKLPLISFPVATTKKNLSYTIDTVDGKLPVFLDEGKKLRDRMKVYKISHSTLTLLDLQIVRNSAHGAGFGGNGLRISGDTYRFVRRDLLQKTLDIDIVEKNFNITSKFPFNEEVLAAANLPDQLNAVKATTAFLQKINAFPQDIDPLKTKAQLLKLKNGIVFSAENLNDAQLLRIDYFQKNLETFPIYYPKGIYSTMNFLVASGPKESLPIVQSDFFHQTITQQTATYPIKPIASAYQELVDGKGYIASNFVKGNTIKILDIYLGYFASDETQDFLMPIYVFKGREDEFYAYVPAIADDWIGTPGQSASPSISK
ncbi:MAG: hypothetical protein Q8Q49_04895 [bacterium]|nr:hypothetical protein [bacterium]